MPALSLPLMHGPDGLPLGVQLVGRRHDDARLLRTARWLQAQALAASHETRLEESDHGLEDLCRHRGRRA